jgi:hypothetical protein
VHYGCWDHLILIGLINIETGEEADPSVLEFYSKRNNISVVTFYDKTLGDTLLEDRPNTEGYVISWLRKGQSPIKVKVKHEGFLKLQKIVHSATPKAILQALRDNRPDLIYDWISTSNVELASYVQTWSHKFITTHWRLGLAAKHLALKAKLWSNVRKEQAAFILTNDPKIAPICFARLDGKTQTAQEITWKLVEKELASELKDAKYKEVFQW